MKEESVYIGSSGSQVESKKWGLEIGGFPLPASPDTAITKPGPMICHGYSECFVNQSAFEWVRSES